MKRTLYRLFSVALILLVAVSCEKNPIEKANDEYDYSKIYPVVASISGPTEVAAHGLPEFPSTYSVPTRGGSSWDWTVTTKLGIGQAGIVKTEDGRIAEITFPQRSQKDTATVSVVETTHFGVVSEAKTLTVVLTAFCPYDMDVYYGNYTGTGTRVSDPVVLSAATGLNKIKIKGLADFVSSSWGETWVQGDGSCIAEFKCGNVVAIPKQEIGKTDYPDTYHLEGTGTFDPGTMVIELDYIVYYTGGDVGYGHTTLTKQ